MVSFCADFLESTCLQDTPLLWYDLLPSATMEKEKEWFEDLDPSFLMTEGSEATVEGTKWTVEVSQMAHCILCS